jgi:hypothetical protein
MKKGKQAQQQHYDEEEQEDSFLAAYRRQVGVEEEEEDVAKQEDDDEQHEEEEYDDTADDTQQQQEEEGEEEEEDVGRDEEEAEEEEEEEQEEPEEATYESESERAYHEPDIPEEDEEDEEEQEGEEEEEEEEEDTPSSGRGRAKPRPLPAATEPITEKEEERAAVARQAPTALAGMRTTTAAGPRQTGGGGLRRAMTTMPTAGGGGSQVRPSLDYLKSYGPMPVGFRPSTIALLCRKGKCSIAAAMTPALGAAGVSYRDLAVDPATQTVRKRFVRSTCKVTVVAAKMIPPPGAPAQVVSRRIRAVLWDSERSEPIGSSHMVLAAIESSSRPKEWKFSGNQGIWVRRSGENAFLLRSGSASPAICLLLELCIVVRRLARDDAGAPTAELSCGWGKLPLFNKDGEFVALNHKHKVPLEGGTPYDAGIAIDPLEEAAKAKTKECGPTLTVKLSSLSRAD